MPTLQVDITGLSLWKFIGPSTIEVLFPVATTRNPQHVPMVQVTDAGQTSQWADLTGSILDITINETRTSRKPVIPPWMLPLHPGARAPILNPKLAQDSSLVCTAVRLPWIGGSFLEACSTLRGPVEFNGGNHWVDCDTRWITEVTQGSLKIAFHTQSGATYPPGSSLGDLARMITGGDLSIKIENHTVDEHRNGVFIPTQHGEPLAEVGDLLGLTDAPGAASPVPVYYGRGAWAGSRVQINTALNMRGGSSRLCPQASVAVAETP